MAERPAGKIIYLSGTSSAGKSTLARELQKVLPEPYLFTGIDIFIYMMPPGYWDDNPAGFTFDKTERGTEIKMGSLAQDLYLAMLDTVENLARSGRNIIEDDVILSQEYFEACCKKLAGLPLLFVKVFCPFEIAEERERARGDREPGMVKFQYDRVQAIKGYNFEVNTAANSSQECALQIKERLVREGLTERRVEEIRGELLNPSIKP